MIEKLINDCKDKLYKKFDLDNQTDNYPRRLARYNHSLKVLDWALKLSDIYEYADKTKVVYASIFHDFAKFASDEQYLEIINKYNLDKSLMNKEYKNVRHAILGSYIVKEELGIVDQEVLDAITFHATGKKNMTLLEKIVFVSDYAETSRVGEIFEKVRNASLISLDEAVLIESALSIENIKSRGLEVVGLTIDCYNYYKDKVKK